MFFKCIFEYILTQLSDKIKLTMLSAAMNTP